MRGQEAKTMDSKFTPLQGKVPISFKRLMALKKTGDDVFESLTAAWPPAPFQRAFGGHVYAQAMYAASRTVEKGLVVHVRFILNTRCPSTIAELMTT